VAVQVVVPLNSSAEERVLLPVEEPPATSTLPSATILLGSTVMLWPTRGEVIRPAEDHVPFENPGSNVMALARTLEPFFPPVRRILPFEFGKTTAVCCSRGGLGIDASVLKAFCTGS
jgi:hypothetical protein